MTDMSNLYISIEMFLRTVHILVVNNDKHYTMHPL